MPADLLAEAEIDDLLRPHFDVLMQAAGRPALFDAHTHIGANDPDKMRQTPGELLDALGTIGARGVVFPMHEPGGYTEANDEALAAAARADGRLVAFCRVDPHRDALQEAERALDAGARGIKLHPRAERFTLHEPAVRRLVALAHERRVPVLIHAGRGIPALGRDTVALAGEFADATLILAHCAISDIAWLWHEVPRHRNLLIDTSWWHPSDFLALFALVPPGNIVWASDSPYGRPLVSAILAARCALQAGLGPEQLRGVMGGQLERLLAGAEPLDLGPAPGPGAPVHPLLERAMVHLTGTMVREFSQQDPVELLGLARLACAVGEDGPHATLFSEILELLNLYEARRTPAQEGRVTPVAGRLLLVALILARTPDVPLPERPSAPPPTREQAE